MGKLMGGLECGLGLGRLEGKFDLLFCGCSLFHVID